MSSTTSAVYGRGFETENISFKSFIKFLLNHDTSVEDMYNDNPAFTDKGIRLIKTLRKLDIESLPDTRCYDADEYGIKDKNLLEELTESLSCCSCNDEYEQFMDIVADVIAHETKINVQFERAQSDEEGEESIILAETMPWNFTEYEASLTEEKFDEIIMPYAKELDAAAVSVGTEMIDFRKIVYYG